MEEYMSLTSSSGHFSITYDKYFMMFHNACIRYDKTLKQKPSTTSRAAYQHELPNSSSNRQHLFWSSSNKIPKAINIPSQIEQHESLGVALVMHT